MIKHSRLSIHENGNEVLVPTKVTQEVFYQNKEPTPDALIETTASDKVKNISGKVYELESIPCTSLTENKNVTFEDLLLSTVKQLPNAPTKNKKRLCPGSEVLTSQQAIDVLKKKSQQKGNGTKIHKITKAKNKKRNKRESLSFSSSEDDESMSPIFMDSDNTDEFLDTLLKSEPEVEIAANDDEEDKENLNSTKSVNVYVGCWVLVKYCPKKIKSIVGIVLENMNDEWIVKFTRPQGNKFVWPINPDIDTVLQQDIIKVLPDPIVDRRGIYEFPVTFKGFNIQH
ncbi:uncharacterized protein [Diabrotica undecimpunctata]|uniref:uncharacterized protein n=1 Tax=Diabrotica undecimpunctata TaxID=50387 RepID=UPI003B636024